LSLTCLIAITSAGCANTVDTVQEPTDKQQTPTPDTSIANKKANWVDYADPKADANMAIDKGDMRLLAFANRVINFPGIDASLHDSLKDSCGYRVLPGTGDMLRVGQSTERLTKLRKYATLYNQQIATSCETK